MKETRSEHYKILLAYLEAYRQSYGPKQAALFQAINAEVREIESAAYETGRLHGSQSTGSRRKEAASK